MVDPPLHPTVEATAEEIASMEIRGAATIATAAIGDITVANPAFDLTPPRYVDAIITERGQFPPESIVTLMGELFGESGGGPWEESDGREAK